MNRLRRVLGAVAVVTMMAAPAGPANASVLIEITQSAGNVDVTATGSLDLTDATFDHYQTYSTGIIPGGSNWYIALGTTPGIDWYRLTSVDVPFGTSGGYFSSSSTSGDAFGIWGFGGVAPLVGVSTGYTSGNALSADMVLDGQTISGMSLIPGTYTFAVPDDTVVLDIKSGVPEPSTWGLMLIGIGGIGVAMRKSGRKQFDSASIA